MDERRGSALRAPRSCLAGAPRSTLRPERRPRAETALRPRPRARCGKRRSGDSVARRAPPCASSPLARVPCHLFGVGQRLFLLDRPGALSLVATGPRVALGVLAPRGQLRSLSDRHFVLGRDVKGRDRRDDAVLHAQIDQRRAAFAVFEHLGEARRGPASAQIAAIVEGFEFQRRLALTRGTSGLQALDLAASLHAADDPQRFARHERAHPLGNSRPRSARDRSGCRPRGAFGFSSTRSALRAAGTVGDSPANAPCDSPAKISSLAPSPTPRPKMRTEPAACSAARAATPVKLADGGAGVADVHERRTPARLQLAGSRGASRRSVRRRAPRSERVLHFERAASSTYELAPPARPEQAVVAREHDRAILLARWEAGLTLLLAPSKAWRARSPPTRRSRWPDQPPLGSLTSLGRTGTSK